MPATKNPLKREFWRPEDTRIWVRRQRRWGRGWTINWAAVGRRLGPRRELGRDPPPRSVALGGLSPPGAPSDGCDMDPATVPLPVAVASLR